MGMTIAQKIIKNHLLSDSMACGEEISIKIDQTLTQDSTGTMAYLQLEALNVDCVKTQLSVAYVDHNTLQSGFENADDHKYIETAALRHGVRFSRPGNGICHQVHLERFAAPGKTLIGSDSHTPTAGGIGCLAIGAGGADVAMAMAGSGYYLKMPQFFGVELTGKLPKWVTAKDVILHILKEISVKGGVGYILEYFGDGVATLSVPERAVITNMGAEHGATTSIFPSDDVTRSFLTAQGRQADWIELSPDKDAVYDKEITVDLSAIVPLAAKPHSPDFVDTVDNIGEIKIDQVYIGSCTNGSYSDMMKAAAILKGKTVHPDVSLVIGPGSKQVLNMLAAYGALADMIDAGARILESACGPCIGMGQAPRTGGVSLRTSNRNFEGRSGTASAGVYLVSPEVAAISAITGVLTNPMVLGDSVESHVHQPQAFLVNDNMITLPPADRKNIEIVRGPNIKPFPIGKSLEETITAPTLLKVGDNITTDHIMPSNASLLPYRSNIPYLSDYCFIACDPGFPARAKKAGGGIIIAGDNYGQGSSREHAALVPLYLGVRAVVAKSFARIHASNLVNSGILPLAFADPADYDTIDVGDTIELPNIRENIENGNPLVLRNLTKNTQITTAVTLSERQKEMILAGGLLNYVRGNANE